MSDVAMDFEITMRLVFGERAYHIADEHGHGPSRARWIHKLLKVVRMQIDKLNTTVRHRQMLMGEVEAFASLLKPSSEPNWSMIYRLLRLIFRLLGFDYVHGARCHTLEYWQSTPQHLNTVVFEGGDIMQDYYDKKNAVALRRQAAEALRIAGSSEYMIALALNTTEYELRKLRSPAASEA